MGVLLMAAAGWVQAAEGGPPPLTYAAPADCPTAEAFVEALSARGERPVGWVVRVEALESGERLGTLDIGDETRVVRGASCAEVLDGLVAAAAELGLPERAPTPAAEPAAPTRVQVTMTSPRPGLTVALTDRGTDDLCFTPCTFEVSPAIHEVTTYGRGTRTVRMKMAFEQPEVHLESRPVSGILFVGGVALSGYSAMAMLSGGMTMLVTGRADRFNGGLLASGAVAGAVGLPLMLHNGKIRVVDRP